ncbi:uncharacterized protein KY384_006839 [Bacidia gigantensis]|uniref:uncharacterized protein n=1 Tax=Bacidia gigantensis TaxID=2732470 RepID=UPI001D04C576|nr:uncharacterized protein KY384_006839 [Bacidia gigantensis]KAG8527923.1 hypothetical protein KY384_006839 [Bacidia gigantensis]
MAPRLCCGSKRSLTPPDSPVRLREVEETGRRFTISTDFTNENSTDFGESIDPIYDIFHPSNLAVHETPESSQFFIRRRESLQRLQHAADRLKRKVLSGTPSPKSKDIDIRGEYLDFGSDSQSRGLHDPINIAIREHRTDMFDDDAVPIQTPKASWSRQDARAGSLQMSPSQLKRLLNRSSSSRPDSLKAIEHTLPAPPSPIPSNAGTYTKSSKDKATQVPSASYEELEYGQATCGDTVPKSILPNRSPGSKSNSLASPLRTSHNNSQDDSQARETASTKYSLEGHDGRPIPDFERQQGVVAKSQAAEFNRFKPPAWRRSASGTLDQSTRPAVDFVQQQETGALSDEKSQPGGVDGATSGSHIRSHSDGSGSVHLYNMRISERLASNGRSTTVSLPQLRDASRSELSLGTNPEFLVLKRRQISSPGFSSSKVPSSWGSPKRNQETSGCSSSSHRDLAPISRAEYDENSGGKEIDAQSPLILSQSAIDSLQSSRSQSQELDCYPFPTSVDGLIHIPKTRLSTAKIDNLRTLDTLKLATRSKSLSTVESGHAEKQNLLRRACTVTENRYFSQADIDDLAASIASRSPPSSRRASTFDGSNDGSVGRERSRSRQKSTLDPSRADWNRPGKLSIAAGYEPVGSSVWDKALFEHAIEDRRLSHYRPGSVSDEHVKRWKQKRAQISKSSLQDISSSSIGQGLDEDVQAHLGAFTLSPPLTTPDVVSRHPPQHGHNRTSSSTSTSSSWSRFPAYSRRDRIETSANESDNVFPRDFAPAFPEEIPSISVPGPPVSPVTPTTPPKPSSPAKRLRARIQVIKKSHSSPIPKLRKSVQNMYHAKSQEVVGRLAVDEARGHKSSVSEGVMGEYPELEMLAPLSPSSALGFYGAGGGEGEGRDYFQGFAFSGLSKKGKEDLKDGDRFGRRGSGGKVSGARTGTGKDSMIGPLKTPTLDIRHDEKKDDGVVSSPPTTLPSPSSTATGNRKRTSSIRSGRSARSSRSGGSKREDAKGWSKLYESCVCLPPMSSGECTPSGNRSMAHLDACYGVEASRTAGGGGGGCMRGR